MSTTTMQRNQATARWMAADSLRIEADGLRQDAKRLDEEAKRLDALAAAMAEGRSLAEA